MSPSAWNRISLAVPAILDVSRIAAALNSRPASGMGAGKWHNLNMTKQSFHAGIWAKLLSYNRKSRLIEAGDRILAAVSGGPDSVCLAHYLHRLSRKMGLALRILHCNHGLRGASAERDAEEVAALGRRLGIAVEIQRLPVSEFARSSGRSLEDAARTLRYLAMARAAKRWKADKIATGHQMDDQAETVLLNILRGTRAKGLAGIPPRRALAADRRGPIGKTPLSARRRGLPQTRGRRPEIVRPLLCLSRREVLAYLQYHKLGFSTDSSNFSERFTRNWIRRKVIPLLERRNPKIREHLASIAEDVRLQLSARGGTAGGDGWKPTAAHRGCFAQASSRE